jgi:MFS family permease
MKRLKTVFCLFPFWMYIVLFKSAASLHYTIFPVLGERLFPIWVVGLIVSAEAFAQMCLDVPAGYLLDRFGYVRTLKISSACFLLGACLFLFGLHPWTLLTGLLFSLIGWLFFGPGIDAYVLVKSEKHIAGRFMAMRDMTASAGVVIGMVILPFALHLNVQWIAVILAFLFTLSLIALSRASKDTASVHEEKKIAHQSFYVRRRFVHHVLRALKNLNPVSSMLMLQRFSAGLFYGIIWFVIPLMIARMAQKGVLSFGLIVFDMAILITGFFLGRLTDKWNKRWLVFWGMLIFSVSGILLGFHFGILFILFGFLATTGDEMASISLWAWLDALDKKHTEDGLIAGALTLAEDLGWTIGPLMAGILYESTGPTQTIFIGALFVTGAWLISSLLMLPSSNHASTSLRPIREYLPRTKPHKR